MNIMATYVTNKNWKKQIGVQTRFLQNRLQTQHAIA